MKIVCLVQREGGSEITIGNVLYHFQPNEEGQHVCDVDDELHARRFLSIPEAYHEHGKQPQMVEKRKPQPAVRPGANKVPVVDPRMELSEDGRGLYDVFDNDDNQIGAGLDSDEAVELLAEYDAELAEDAKPPSAESEDDKADETEDPEPARTAPYLKDKGAGWFLLFNADGTKANDGKAIRGEEAANQALVELMAPAAAPAE